MNKLFLTYKICDNRCYVSVYLNNKIIGRIETDYSSRIYSGEFTRYFKFYLKGKVNATLTEYHIKNIMDKLEIEYKTKFKNENTKLTFEEGYGFFQRNIYKQSI